MSDLQPPAAAFLSVRLPPAMRDRLKAAAASRGQTVQTLVGSLVERFLDERQGPPPLAAVLATLRPHAAALATRGVAELWVFGSVARGEARPDSDVDLMVAFKPGAQPSLLGLASLRADLSELLGVTADLVEREALRPAVRTAADREAVRVL